MDGGGHRWRWKPAIPARMDTNGHPWTPLGDLRIRRLGFESSRAVLALRYRAIIDEIADTYHPYLTMAEAHKLAVQGFAKDVKTLS